MRRSVLTRRVILCVSALMPVLSVAAPLPVDELPPAVAGTADPVTYPELWINGNSTGEFIRVERVLTEISDTPHFLLDAADLKAQGIVLTSADKRADGRVEIWRLPDMPFVYQQSSERFLLTLPLSRLALNRFRAEPAVRRAQTASRGLLLNYDVLTQTSRSDDARTEQRTAGFGELRWFGRTGYFTQTMALRMDETEPAQLRRLDSAWRYSSPDSLWTVQAGDAISAGVDSQNAYRFGGLQWRRNFALRPDLVTFPTPLIAGSSAVPATVDVLLDNIRQYSQDVPAGPFEIDNIPFSTTAGDMRVVVRDVLGREQVAVVPLYSVINLLRPGLVDFAVQTGFLRRRYAERSTVYDRDPVASAAIRYGVSERFTVEAHGEAADGLGMAGVGAALAVGRWSTLSLVQAASRDRQDGRERSGRRSRLAYQYQSVDGWSLSASSLRVDDDFRDIASRDNLFQTRRLEQIGGGASLGRFGSLGANLIASELADGTRDRFFNASWSRSLAAQWHIYLSWTKGLDGADQETLFLGLSWYPADRLGVDSSVSLARGEPAEYTLGVQQRRTGETGLGWAVRSRTGSDLGSSHLADVDYRGALGETGLLAEHADGSDSLRLEHSGSLVLMGGGVHAGRRINQSFAVVDTGLPDVPVRLENRLIGKTDSQGQFLVSELRPYQRNRISIDVIDIPEGYVVRDAVIDAVPPEQVGVHVAFPVSEPQAALLTLVDAEGKPLPVGAQGRIRGSQQGFVVGYDGEVYLEDLVGSVTATLIYESTRCTVVMEIPRGTLARKHALPPSVCRVMPVPGRPGSAPAMPDVRSQPPEMTP